MTGKGLIPVNLEIPLATVAFLLLCFLMPTSLPSSEEDRKRWDVKYSTPDYIFGTAPVKFLKDHIRSLPGGRALDVAMGEGRNAVYLAQMGYEVDGIDISKPAVEKAVARAKSLKVRINGIVADLEDYKIPPRTYNVIAVFYYLQRSLIPQIMEGLKPGGVVIYETYTVDYLKKGAMKREYLLEHNELPRLFPGFEILYYKEDKATAGLIARKP
ncbi:MAG: class I SAM-dependent methyltransferase [Armatimonadetes bacterium]|nr:class I SAM-dependent methyltransferase [Armatimonadota bacterium]